MTDPYRTLAPGHHCFERLEVGQSWETGTVTVDSGLVDRFAKLSGDEFEIHLDDAAARAAGFPGRIAHGLLILSLADGLSMASPVQLPIVAALGWDWRFVAPVFIGDTIRLRLEIAEMRATRQPDRGLLFLDGTVTTEAGTVVQHGRKTLILRRGEMTSPVAP